MAGRNTTRWILFYLSIIIDREWREKKFLYEY